MDLKPMVVIQSTGWVPVVPLVALRSAVSAKVRSSPSISTTPWWCRSALPPLKFPGFAKVFLEGGLCFVVFWPYDLYFVLRCLQYIMFGFLGFVVVFLRDLCCFSCGFCLRFRGQGFVE